MAAEEVSMNGKEPDEHEGLCPRCGAEAKWLYLDPEKTRIEVICRDCGRYEISREEFDQTAIDNADLKEADRE